MMALCTCSTMRPQSCWQRCPNWRLRWRGCKLSAASSRMKDEDTKDKLLQRCFATPVAQIYHGDIGRFHAKVYTKRW
eukprot:12928381-Prorocentrum_lima.AAC.1